MASRRQIKDAFYDELASAVVGSHTVTYEDGTTETVTLDEHDVTLVNPDFTEQLPAVAYDDEFIPRTVNGVGNGPDNQVYDSNGQLQTNQFREYRTGIFTVFVGAHSDVVKEPLYEAVHKAFGKYDTSFAQTGDFHADVDRITVEDTSSTDVTDTEVTTRIDTLTVNVEFYRNYDENGDVIQSVEGDTDVSDADYNDSTST